MRRHRPVLKVTGENPSGHQTSDRLCVGGLQSCRSKAALSRIVEVDVFSNQPVVAGILRFNYSFACAVLFAKRVAKSSQIDDTMPARDSGRGIK
jgi:hypothetical protein